MFLINFHSAQLETASVVHLRRSSGSPLNARMVELISTSSVHSSFPQNAILFNPKALSRLDHKWVPASHLLEWEEVEVGQLVPREVEVLPYPSVPVVPHCSSVLCAPLPAGPCVTHFADILAWLSKALPCPM